MQISPNSPEPFIKSMAEKSEKIRTTFLDHVKNLTTKVRVKVMLGDGTVSNHESFDPALLKQFYTDFLRKLEDWKNDGVSVSTDKDLRRIFIKFEKREGNYLLSGNMSLQYHALLFYKPEYRVIEIRKEISELTDRINELQAKGIPQSEKIIEEKLRQKGYKNPDHQKLFEVLFEHDDLTDELVNSLDSDQSTVSQLTKKREELFRELDSTLIEIYQTNPVLIDEIRMIGAEEGCLCNFNLEHIKNNLREGNFDITRISTTIKENLLKRMDEIIKVLKM